MKFFGYTLYPEKFPRHVAFIMDGNGRWARQRFLPRNEGHKKGYETLKRIIEFNENLQIPYISAYAFSTENWERPREEVDFLMDMAAKVIDEYVDRMKEKNIRFCYTGSFERISPRLRQKFEHAIDSTKNGRYVFNIVFNYGGRKEITDAAKKIALDIQKGKLSPEEISENIFEQYLYSPDIPPVDLLIRTSGEQRISNFLLWESAYAELYFTSKLWPDFSPKDFCKALADYQKRQRRFGKI
ncbi:polyprenyl diphosphate synthase [Thermospira aquatica]|uniref:Isoprenyl transferase n=1 Tax=Thermospira aquatica TaxID=2828656 RepID=A0AAX3BCG4_9SPIR|nr:polyprenyl diphosphate synthase [Thermospira aquatica]URA09965.1 di-trans,poly-cis-decaprenylcistransferase [Thermospira aquatica]